MAFQCLSAKESRLVPSCSDISQDANDSRESSNVPSLLIWSRREHDRDRSISPTTENTPPVPDEGPLALVENATKGEITAAKEQATFSHPSATGSIHSQHRQSRHAPGAQDPFEGPKPIPGLSPVVFVYPHSSGQINEAFKRRYHEVIELFKQSVEKDAHLIDHVRHIGYELRLCGPSPREAHPSILVFCRTRDHRALRSLLTKSRLKRQYALRKSSLLKTWIRRQSTLPIDGHRPLFNLFFCRDQTPWIFLWGSQKVFRDAEGASNANTTAPGDLSMTMCGSAVRWPGPRKNYAKTSTISCVVQIGNDFYGLTTAHAAIPSQPDVLQEHAKLSNADRDEIESPGSSQFDESDLGDYVMDDFTYEHVSEDETSTEATQGQQDDALDFPSLIDHDVPPTTMVPGQSRALSAQYPSRVELLFHNHMDLDWAIMKLEDPRDWRPNAFTSPECGVHYIGFLSSVSEGLVDQETPVFIIVSPDKSLTGMLQPSVSFQTDMSGVRVSEYWTVIPSAGNEMKCGNSGSLVVDARTHSIYGFVVAANPFGEIHISPLAGVLEQIRTYFPGLTVRLPPKRPNSGNLMSFYLERDHEGNARHPSGILQDTNIDEVLSFKNHCLQRFRVVTETVRHSQHSDFRDYPQEDYKPSFAITWEHSVLPFLSKFLPKWCGHRYALCVVRGLKPGSRRIYFATRYDVTTARRLMIAALVRDLLGIYRTTTKFKFVVGQIHRPDPRESTSRDSEAELDAKIGIAESNRTQISHGTYSGLEPTITVDRELYSLVNYHSFHQEHRETNDSQMIKDPSPKSEHTSPKYRFKNPNTSLLQHRSEAHEPLKAEFDVVYATSGTDRKTTRISGEPYWKDSCLEAPLLIMDWALVKSRNPSTAKAMQEKTMMSDKGRTLSRTNVVVPASGVITSGGTAGRTAGAMPASVCEVPAFLSAEETGAGKATREWFVEEAGKSNESYAESEAPAVYNESGILIGQFWGSMKPADKFGLRLAFFTPINDVLQDIREKLEPLQSPVIKDHHDFLSYRYISTKVNTDKSDRLGDNASRPIVIADDDDHLDGRPANGKGGMTSVRSSDFGPTRLLPKAPGKDNQSEPVETPWRYSGPGIKLPDQDSGIPSLEFPGYDPLHNLPMKGQRRTFDEMTEDTDEQINKEASDHSGIQKRRQTGS